MKKNVCVVTGSRAEYGYLRPLLKKLKECSHFNTSLLVTGMHLLKKYGYTLNEIKKDGFKIFKTIDMDIKTDNSVFDLAASVGKGMSRISCFLERNAPDILVVFGDRVEAFAAAAAASISNIVVAHINGGDVGMGDIDNNLRHAITKLSHIHLAASEKSARRIKNLGEEKWRIYKVGSLTLDTILNDRFLTKDQIIKKYEIPNKPIILVSYHPVTSEWENAGTQMKLIMSSLSKIKYYDKYSIVIIFPNAYPGGNQILKIIVSFKKRSKNIYSFSNLPHLDFISLMSASSMMIGNSSSGIIEAPSLGIPFVSVGTRQHGREKGGNVIETGYRLKEISEGIEKALNNEIFLKDVRKCKNPYGDGKASDRIVNILSKIKLNSRLIQKKITY